MTEVRFYDTVEDKLIKFSVIISKYGKKWVLCKHKERKTLEVPGGHREPGETLLETARRELYEETGAVDFTLSPVCVYSVEKNGELNFGLLCFAGIKSFETELHSEMEKIFLLDELPDNWTYPDIQPKLIEEAARRGFIN